MYNVNDLFYKPEGKTDPIEGYLGDEAKKDCKILFVLREPHATVEDTAGFWFYNVVNNHCTDGKRYVNVLGRLSAKLLNEQKGLLSEEKQLNCYKELLKRCAFMNLYPFCGDKTKSENFKQTLVEIGNADVDSAKKLTCGEKEKYKAIAANRLGIINGLKPRYIITVCDIFDSLRGKLGTATPNGLLYKGKQFDAIDMDNGTKVLAFYHPSYTRIAYDYLDEIKLGWEKTRS